MTSRKLLPGNLPNEVEEIDARHDIQKNADGSGRRMVICHWKIWVQYVPLPLDENANITPLPGC